MLRWLPSSFRFSWKITVTAVLLAAVMIRCSFWQYERYLWKTALVASYTANQTADAAPFPAGATSAADFEPLLYKKVHLRGHFDFSKQVTVLNQRHASGPGFLLLAPFVLADNNRQVIVSRGFIPYADSTPESWEKYSLPESEIVGVVQATRPKRPLVDDRRLKTRDAGGLSRQWLHPNIEGLAEELGGNTIPWVYLQRIGAPLSGTFPAEAISIKVPPSTHFGYTIEWAILAFITLLVGFLLQAFPRRRLRYNS